VLTDRRLVKQLIDKKSNIYSQRPDSHVGDLIAGGDHILIMQYSAQWREARRLIHQYFMESKAESYVDLVDAEAVQCLRDMCVHPEEFMLHPKRFSNSVIMSLGAT